jgi:asparagine synthase (glutamine-hydrolysing)
MPGITVMLNADARLFSQNDFGAAQRQMKHHDDYMAWSKADDGLCAGHVSYPGYPVRKIEGGSCTILLEGRIYTHTQADVDNDPRSLADCFVLNEGPDTLAHKVTTWIQMVDGEFVVVLADSQKQRIAVFSDILGRLPLYSYVDKDRLLVARECKFVQALKPSRDVDLIGCAQMLWLSYTLGSRTLLKDVQREPGACYIWAQAGGGSITCVRKSLFSYNFEEKNSPRSLEHEAREVAELFISACARRGRHPDITTNILSLSGGQDSRAVAAGYRRAGIPFIARTYIKNTDKARRDARMAEKISRAISVDWSLVQANRSSPELEDELVWMKDGLNYSAMAYILEYCRALISESGRQAVYVSGDGGDKVLPDLRPGKRLSNDDELVLFKLGMNGAGTFQAAAALVGIEPRRIIDDVRFVLSGCPEQDIQQKAVHFTIYERGRKWLYEGEDRTRFFLWQTSPFYDREFFSRCMSVPDNFKVDFRFHSRVLKLLNPDLMKIPDAHLGIAPGDFLYPLKRALVRHYFGFPAWLRESVRLAVKGRRPSVSSDSKERLQELIRQCAENNFLDSERLKA